MRKRRWGRTAGLLLAVAIAASPAVAQPSSAAGSADALFAAVTPATPGMVALVAKGDEILYAKAFGAADLEQRTPVALDTRFHVASVSKQFTAFALALLAREGKIDLEGDIRTYLPELPDFGAKIKVSHLIHHTSGLRDHWDLFVLSGTSLQSLLRQPAILSLLRNQRGLNFAPGSEYRYSNSGYSLGAEIVAKVSGMPFSQFVKERIFTPLGMKDSLVYDDAAQLVPGRAQSYRTTPSGKIEIARLNYSNYGATSVFTTAPDLLKWGRELLRPKVFDANLIKSLSQPGKLNDGRTFNYGFGLAATEVAGRPALLHGGSDAGFRAFFAVYPADDATIVVLSNGAVDGARFNESLAELFLNGSVQGKPVVPASPAQLAALTGYYWSNWGSGVELKLSGNSLVRGTGASPAAAVFRPDGTFDFPGSSTRFRPLKGADGSIAGFEELSLIGPPVQYRRVQRATPSVEALRLLAGDYRSPELDITYRLSMVKDRLVLTTLRMPEPVELMPAEQDRFDSSVGSISFGRDARGKATGFSVTSGRSRGIKFIRQSGS